MKPLTLLNVLHSVCTPWYFYHTVLSAPSVEESTQLLEMVYAEYKDERACLQQEIEELRQ